ncbi:MAG: HDOD domain-containing protein [Fibrobacterota bacterium]|nr:MAG: HDOD domain-containing protein [Fibrobacterota bacterium]
MRIDVPESRILLVDDDERFRSGLAVSLSDYGFGVMEASTAPSALEIATRQKPTACVLETNLAGVDGIQFIKYLRSRHVFRLLPVLVVTRSITKDVLAQLVRLGVQTVMVKPSFSFEQLVSKLIEVSPPPDLFRAASSSRGPSSAPPADSAFSGSDPESSCAAAASAPESSAVVPDSPPLRLLAADDLARLASLKALPTVIEDVLDTASRPTSSLEDLEKVLRKDPVIASQVIRAANSAAYSRGASVSRIDEALQLLGFKSVVRISMACGLVSRSDLRRANGDDMRAVWCNALCNAMVMERLSIKQDAARNYAMALVRNVPFILLMQHLEGDWAAWREWSAQKNKLMDQLVEASCGLSLVRLVESVFASMNLPRNIQDPLTEYFRFFTAKERMEPGLVARKLDLVNQIAIYLGRPGCLLSEVRCIHLREVESGPFLAVTGEEFVKEIELLEASIGILGGADCLSNGDLGSIVLWRDARWSPMDPIGSFLEQISDCVTVNFVQDLLQSSRPGVAIVEPRTPEWEVLRASRKRMVILHSESVAPDELPSGAVAIRFPLPLCQLQIQLEKALK